MIRKILFILLTGLACAASLILANHFAEEKLNLQPKVAQSIRWFESLFLNIQEVDVVVIKALENKQENPQPNGNSADDTGQNYSHAEVGNRPVCVDTSLGEVKYKKVGNIYTWTDDNGIYHVSDKAPDEGQFELLSYAGEKVFDYFNLDLNTESLPYDFNQNLTVRLNKVFELYGQLLDRDSLKKVDIKLHVYQSKTAFNQIKKQHNMSTADNINGFYSHSNNKAYLLFRSNKRTMRTAAHEATHAINRAIIGYTPRWLNEGLAEYSEFIHVVGNSAKVYPNSDWTKKNVISKDPLPLNTLFSATSSQWDSDLRQRLYATSWAFIYYMMEHPKRKSVLAKLIKIEQQNLCNVTPLNEVEEKLGVRLNILQNQFSRWARSKLRRQSI
ncbi:hypothetical protein [Colwellia echini]|uniref:DUF1570 domain-containing protein n=1 Tax=Colwellia echini TaxID=1982103 RepID=A0ABY3MXS2_9GAMM|nr:hypothetical protein [Colwellia echini]TYK66008.1 hypothetical protein CWS31_006970 [Colwellia echini]